MSCVACGTCIYSVGMSAPARQLVIASENGKGRSFTASLLAYIRADKLWPNLDHDETIRPAWMMFAASDYEATPFKENLSTGRKAVLLGSSHGKNKPTMFECLRSAGYLFVPQRHPEGTVWQAFIPDLFRIDTGLVDPKGVTFILSPERASRSWEAACAPRDIEAAVDHIRRIGFFSEKGYCDTWHGRPYPSPDQVRAIAPLSAFFAVSLARRTRAPLIADARFYLQIMIEMLKVGQASISHVERHGRDYYFGDHEALGFIESAVEDVGLVPGIACKTTHDDLEKLLAEQIQIFVREVS